MKRCYLYIIISIFYTGLLYSQRGIEAGALVQPQIYGQWYDQARSEIAVKIPYSFAIGINAGYNFSDNFGFRSGFIYSPLGEKYADTATDPETSYDLNLEYIQIPLYLKLNTSLDRSLSGLIIAGPHLGFLNNATLAIDNEDPESVIGDYKRIIYGGSVGVGIQLNLDDGNFNVLWRTNGSIIQVQDGTVDNPSLNMATGLQFSYHYFISI